MAFTIRDQQMADKERRDAMEAEYEKRMDIAMEIDRLKELSAREKQENTKLSKRISDRSVIIDQIEARKKNKILQEEAREQENKQMLQTIKKYEEEDAVALRKREANIAKSRIEVIKANKASIESKKNNKIREKEEVDMILAYQAKQDEKMRAREDEENERKRLVNERQKRMLDNQTKTQGKQAEVRPSEDEREQPYTILTPPSLFGSLPPPHPQIDELRARRAMEEGERR